MKIIALDLSTSSSGYAIFDQETKKLLEYGYFTPDKPDKKNKTYPWKPLSNINSIVTKNIALILTNQGGSDITIVIEEINKGISRLGQKVLSGLHFVFLNEVKKLNLPVVYIDSDSRSGWRTILGLLLSEKDKQLNKEHKKLNKQLKKKKYPIVTKKHLACRLVNKTFGFNFDVDSNLHDSDICDSIGLGMAFLKRFE